MTDIDLTEAIEAVKCLVFDEADIYVTVGKPEYMLGEAHSSLVVHAVAPLIIAQVRAQIAADVRVTRRNHAVSCRCGGCTENRRVIALIRGES